MTHSTLIWVLALSVTARAAVLPAGTQLEIRLTSAVASNTSKVKDAVQAVLIRPVASGNEIVLPAGTVVRGVVKDAVPIKGPNDRAVLDLDFTALEPGGKAPALKIAAKVASVDNARESVEESGRITGILASETLASRIEAGVNRVGQKYSKLGEFLGGLRSAVLQEPQPEIAYAPGVEMTLALTKPLECAATAAPVSIQQVAPEKAIYDLVNAQPYRTKTEGGGVPSDMTNLMFLGTEEHLNAAFAAAGWSSAAQLNTASGLEVFRAIAEMRGYKEAPMSILMLDGQKPSTVFQKQNNTFAMRHHLRIWRRPDTFQGHPVWVCAATHDIGIEFSPEQRNFIHKIDSEIDRERAKVVSDLLFAGKVRALSLVARPDVPQQSQNATGDQLRTDGAMAVLLLE